LLAYGYLDENKHAREKLSFYMWLENNLANEIFMLMFGNIFVHPVAFYFNATWFMLKFKRWYVKKYPHKYTQKEAN